MKAIFRLQIFIPATVAAITCFIGHCFAQSNFRFEHYSTRDGLASEMVEHIVQDTLGFIWISYNGGISRFDGYEFKVYQFDSEDSLKSPFDEEFWDELSQDHHGRLWGCRWYFAKDGWQKVMFLNYDYRLDGFRKHNLKFPHTGINPERTFNFSAHDTDNETIWITTIGGGLYRYNIKSGELKNYINAHPDSTMNVENNSFRYPFVHDSYIVLPSHTGIWIFDKITEKFSRPQCSPTDSAILFHSSLGIASTKSVHDPGIWVMDGNSTWYHITDDFRISKKLTFNPDLKRMVNIEEDKDGNLWFTTMDKGLLKYDISSNKWITITKGTTTNSLQTNWLTALLLDRDENLWIGTQEEGISVLRKQGITFYNHRINGFGNVLLYGHNGIDHLIAARSNTYPSDVDAVNEVLTANLPHIGVQEIHWNRMNLKVPLTGRIQEIRRGRRHIWFSTSNGITGLMIDPETGQPRSSFVRFTAIDGNKNTISANFVNGVYEDAHERLWVCPYAGGVNRINNIDAYGKEGSVTRFTNSPGDPSTIGIHYIYQAIPLDSSTVITYSLEATYYLQHDKFNKINHAGVVRRLFKSSTGNIYLGSLDGLYVLEGDSLSGSFKKIPLVKGAVMEIVEDKLGRLWMSNLEGVVCYDPAKSIVLFFDKREGIDHTHGVMFQSSTGNIATANIEGISLFNPRTLILDERSMSPVLTGLRINNKHPAIAGYPGNKEVFTVDSDITVLKELKLDYLHNNFSVEFSAMEMTAPEKNLYRHKLEGYDDDWIETDYKNRTATYTNLDAGTYMFRVKASNHHGVWSDNERTLTVIILPPPWKTAWAYTGYALIIFGILFMARRMIVQRERLKGSLKLAKVEQEKEHFELEKAKEVDRVKTSFFTNISHEFRTPLTLIKGPVDTLLSRFKDDPDVVQRLKLVQRNSDVLLRLINQLLDLAKLDAGTMKVERSNGEVNSFIRAIAGSFESLAGHKNVSLYVEISSDRHQVAFDKDKLETILINLINNAVKFTPAGGSVTVRTELKNLPLNDETHAVGTSLKRGEVVIVVRDTGIGIPVEHQQKIFERFHQVSEAHKEIGTGIGLSLVKELIDLLGGTITISSQPGKGTTFTVIIPVEAGTKVEEIVDELPTPISIEHEHSNNQFQARPSNNGPSERPHILLVEDNNDLRAFIIDSLGQEFYFLEADNGRAGLEVATTEIPDLIISDVMMPEMDGITMAGKIKTDQRSSHIPLILLTAKSTEDSKLQGLKSGADDYLTKPFNREELLLKVRNSITRQVKLREKLRAEVMGNAPAVEAMSEDERFLIRVKEKILERLSDEQLSVESLAEDIGISRVHLYRKVSGLTGVSVNELIRKLRLQRAAQLIGQQWGPVSQVAYEVGYSNLSYFSKIFKEEHGVLPSEYMINS
jgi:signal transduction histidine kinase/DNA-binding response OmpR family regulator/ligand-binding sensor domain-containing protein